jgi:uncharacterized RDD family membrane protein YckC
MTDQSTLPSPFILRRLAALTYDILLVLPLIMACVALVMGARTLLGLGPADDGTVRLDANLVRLLALLTAMAFFCWFWLKNGQTLGMQAWRIKLVTFDGAAPGPWQVIARALGAALSAACLGLGYLWCLVDRNGYYWHDYLSRSKLVLLPSKKKPKTQNVAPPNAANPDNDGIGGPQ